MGLNPDTPRRYFRIDDSGTAWWFVSSTPADAWRQWADWHVSTGATEEPLEAEPVMVELTEEQAARVRVDDERAGAKTNLAALELGATLCSEA